MSATKVVLIGGGEHARVIVDAMRSRPADYAIAGFVDPDPKAPLAREGVPSLGHDTALTREMKVQLVIAFGTQRSWHTRMDVARKLQHVVSEWATIVHASAWVSPSATIGEGTVVMAGAIVQTGARIGAHCVINSGAVVEHDVVLGTNVHVAPRAVIGGGARVGDGCYVGMGASVRDHIEIGDRCVIGMGAVVVASINENRVVRGVPAR